MTTSNTTSANDSRLFENEGNSNKNYSMHRDSFGKNKKSHGSMALDEAKINVPSLSIISESVMSSDHPSAFNYKSIASTTSKPLSQATHLAPHSHSPSEVKQHD